MSSFKCFEEIEAWKKSRELARLVYSVSGKGNFSRDFPLRDQIRKASISTMSNIAEGFERKGHSEFAHFLSIAKGSVGELRSQLYLALDQDYLNKELFNELFSRASDISRMLSGLIDYLKKINSRARRTPN